MNKRVVVTGIGMLTPVGNTVPATWEALLQGASGIGMISRFDTTDYPTKIAGEIKDFNPSQYIDKKELRRMDLAEQYAIVATEEAVQDSGLDFNSVDRDRCGVVIGSGIGGISTFEKQFENLLKAGPGRVSPFFIPMMIIDMCAGLVSIRYGLTGPN